jgi:predicted Fe-Mo cluster-binding NifX family protein
MLAQGVDSEVFGHFGSAPAFVIVDTEGGETLTVTNSDMDHEHGGCNPVTALGGHEVACVVVGGIGAGALGKLTNRGIVVYKAASRTVRENLELLRAGGLERFAPSFVCMGHGSGGGCSHH